MKHSLFIKVMQLEMRKRPEVDIRELTKIRVFLV